MRSVLGYDGSDGIVIGNADDASETGAESVLLYGNGHGAKYSVAVCVLFLQSVFASLPDHTGCLYGNDGWHVLKDLVICDAVSFVFAIWDEMP